MTKLSVNINKIATIRNARGGNTPNVVKAAMAAENFGAHGITVHPRPDERHITKQDVYDLKEVVCTEFNIEGYPSKDFIALVQEIVPEQVTLVPDPPEVLTSNAGWNCKENLDFLRDVISEFQKQGTRTSIFLDPDTSQIEYAEKTGTDRIELYTESYASEYSKDRFHAIMEYKKTAILAQKHGLGVNAGHDLNLDNLNYFIHEIPFTEEVSIGHALISDSLYYGLNNTIQMYLNEIANASDS